MRVYSTVAMSYDYLYELTIKRKYISERDSRTGRTLAMYFTERTGIPNTDSFTPTPEITEELI